MHPLYLEILNGIIQRNSLADDAAIATHLRSLQPYAKDLWQSYKTPNIIVDYADPKTQEAYLLRYFPFYCGPLYRQMKHLHHGGCALPNVELLDAVFFGCGPGPEVIGLMRHLIEVKSSTTMISAQLIDSAAATWAYSRDIVLEHVTAPFWAPWLVDYVSITACLTDRAALASAAIDGCHFAVVQNCLNEVPSQLRDAVVGNLMSQFARLAPGAIVLVIDRSGYPATIKMMRDMHALAIASENIDPLDAGPGPGPESSKNYPCWEILETVPEIVTNNMLHRWGTTEPSDWAINHLIFSNNVKYVSMAFKISDKGA